MPVAGHVQNHLRFVSTLLRASCRLLLLHASVSFARSRGADTRVTSETIFIIVKLWTAPKVCLTAKEEEEYRGRLFQCELWLSKVLVRRIQRIIPLRTVTVLLRCVTIHRNLQISYTDLAPFRLCPAHAKCQPRNPRLRMGYVQSNDQRRATRA